MLLTAGHGVLTAEFSTWNSGWPDGSVFVDPLEAGSERVRSEEVKAVNRLLFLGVLPKGSAEKRTGISRG